MKAIRQVKEVKNHQVLVRLPEDFGNKEVEVIIIPLNEIDKEKLSARDKFLKFLLSGPTLSPEEIQRIEAMQREFNQWPIEKF
ncbi:MAG: hypothetical protein U9R23_02940 [Candidatus Cloacimonadota bacterium]|nr:hypothetical protein [Candidatus Cloacimonadota bacterium]